MIFTPFSAETQASVTISLVAMPPMVTAWVVRPSTGTLPTLHTALQVSPTASIPGVQLPCFHSVLAECPNTATQNGSLHLSDGCTSVPCEAHTALAGLL